MIQHMAQRMMDMDVESLCAAARERIFDRFYRVPGKTEQAASGIGWATMMPLAMVGGGMIPLAFMPAWMSALGSITPMKWTILAFEGAIWRGFTPIEMLTPCLILVAFGVVCFAIGAGTLRGNR